MNLLQSIFTSDYVDIQTDNPHTDLTCPYCENGELLIQEKQLKWLDDVEFNKQFDLDPDLDTDFKRFYYLFNLICSNDKCKKNTVTSGYTMEHSIYGNENECIEIVSYKPLYFSKPLHLIHIDSVYPEKVNQLLEESFRLFFIDKMSCANKLRICLESLMDYYKVPRKTKTKNGMKDLALHARIKKCKVLLNTNNADFSLAIKWIGNIGSHNTNDCSNEQLLAAYRLLDYVLQDLFINQPELKKLTKTAKTINKSRGKKI